MAAAEPASPPDLDPVDARLIDRLHSGFPLVERPFAVVGAELGLTENELLERLRRLLSQQRLKRFGPIFPSERAGDGRVLAAMQVPEHRFAAVSVRLDAVPAVQGRYCGTPPFNLCLAIAADSPQGMQQAIASIERETGLSVAVLPQEREYPVESRLPRADGHAAE